MARKQNGRIVFGRIGRLLICIGLALAVVSLSQPLQGTCAERQGKTGSTLPKHYPDKFSGIGRIDRITADQIVINDTLYPLSANVEFATPTRKHASRSSFRVGNRVGYITNEKREIISLWWIK
jgi:hypothetical protein